jgi:hypothetical protein
LSFFAKETVMPFDVRFNDLASRSILLAKEVDREAAFTVVRDYNAQARAKGLKVVKVPHREGEVGAWEHVDHRHLGLPSVDLGRLYVLAAGES